MTEFAFYSLQVDEAAKLLKVYAKKYRNVHDLKPAISDWADTARYISRMDLIISVDTAVAHLAGALAKPVWVLLPYNAEWRWLPADRSKRWLNKSPWYPTMRLFRASSFNAWEEVIEQVRSELRAEITLHRGRQKDISGSL